ncbi:unnamed protein product [Mucor circinelloides]|uniref:Uncharacterized protein n=1 Tax=Mucor circinelloides f. circinelloides (strain 1006PhL) TaxID=1220926 RepID=S2K851_MUCC1|nr:hypothetical protein HMPREF1544_01510 [Mucor circinelloides 1006PhL]KAG1083965.1 hypothetical protein G6F42_021992 [Rhizopus arrhizus]
MQALNTAYPPDATNPLRSPVAEKPAMEKTVSKETIDAAAATNDTAHQSTLHNIKEKMVDIKDNVKETLQRDHHRGQDCAKKPQDGKTNPME